MNIHISTDILVANAIIETDGKKDISLDVLINYGKAVAKMYKKYTDDVLVIDVITGMTNGKFYIVENNLVKYNGKIDLKELRNLYRDSLSILLLKAFRTNDAKEVLSEYHL